MAPQIMLHPATQNPVCPTVYDTLKNVPLYEYPAMRILGTTTAIFTTKTDLQQALQAYDANASLGSFLWLRTRSSDRECVPSI